MTTTFISPVIGKASELGVDLYEDIQQIELRRGASVAEVNTIIRAVYRQVLGNAYVMESERLAIPESKLKEGTISLREFVRQVAKSELYQSRFFDNCPRYRSIELNFKHLLGRAPESYEEINAHSKILDEGGYEAEIDSYLDSEEYQNKFGENIVPYYCGYKTQTGKNIVGFTHLFKLLRGASSSDKNLTSIGNTPRLTTALLNNLPSAIIPPSTASSYGGMTDINQLLAKTLNLQAPPAKVSTSYTSPSYSTSYPQSFSESEQQYEQQRQKIEQLQQKLAALSSFATIGSASINQWQGKGTSLDSQDTGFSANTSTSMESYSGDKQRQVELQKQVIQQLEQKIADAQRLAAIGEARLNKWRSRTFF
jgi:hypothetical protein